MLQALLPSKLHPCPAATTGQGVAVRLTSDHLGAGQPASRTAALSDSNQCS